MPRLLGFLALVLLTPLAACGNSGGEVAQDDLSPSAVMRQAAAHAGSSTFTFTMEFTQGKHVARGSGEYQGGATPALHQVFEAYEGLGTSEFLVIGERAWSRSGDGGMLGVFPAGKWLEFSSGKDDEFSGSDELDFRVFVQTLFAAADVEELGEEAVEGVPTRHFSGTVTAAAVKASPDIDPEIKESLAGELEGSEANEAKIEAWVDREFQIRKFAQTSADDSGPYRMTMTLNNFGQPVSIAAPPKSEVLSQKDWQRQLNRQTREAMRKIEQKYGDEAGLQKACRDLERRFQDSFDAEAETPPSGLPSKEDQALAMACPGAEDF